MTPFSVLIIVLIAAIITLLIFLNRRQQAQIERESRKHMIAGQITALERKLGTTDNFHLMFPCPEADKYRRDVRDDLIPVLKSWLSAEYPDFDNMQEMIASASKKLDELRGIARNYGRPTR